MTAGPGARVGLVGWPVAHSLSPAMHNAAFAALGLDWQYTLLPTPPDELPAVLAGLEAGGYRGANVTVPHKQAVLPLLDRVTGAARDIGAVNTLVFRGGQRVGLNTDAEGFLLALAEAGFEPAGKRALVLGAGGAARAVVFALAGAGCAVAIHNRTPDRAALLAESLHNSGPVPPRAVTLDDVDPRRVDLLVNATSLGMGALATASPWPEALPLPAHWTVLDLVYSPPETLLLARARSAGARAVGGLGMLLHQGALAFTLWTGLPAPLDVMRAALAAQPEVERGTNTR